MLARSIFMDVMATCGAGGVCYVRSDRPTAFSGSLTVTSVDLTTGATSIVYKNAALSLPAGPGASLWFTVPIGDENKTVFIADVVEGGARDDWRLTPTFASPIAAIRSAPGTIVSSNLILLAAPVDLLAPAATVTFTVSSSQNSDGTVDVTLSTDMPALFVTLTTLAQGRFSDNAFALLPGTARVIQYLPFVIPTDIELLKNTLRVEHHATYA